MQEDRMTSFKLITMRIATGRNAGRVALFPAPIWVLD
jgi:hypothetical protein